MWLVKVQHLGFTVQFVFVHILNSAALGVIFQDVWTSQTTTGSDGAEPLKSRTISDQLIQTQLRQHAGPPGGAAHPRTWSRCRTGANMSGKGNSPPRSRPVQSPLSKCLLWTRLAATGCNWPSSRTSWRANTRLSPLGKHGGRPQTHTLKRTFTNLSQKKMNAKPGNGLFLDKTNNLPNKVSAGIWFYKFKGSEMSEL